MNYRRKSTIGYSIVTIMLDIFGATMTMLEMILNAYNYGREYNRQSIEIVESWKQTESFLKNSLQFSDDWISIFGDPTKFGIGLFSLSFDVVFMLQHYVFYRFVTQCNYYFMTVFNKSNICYRTKREIRSTSSPHRDQYPFTAVQSDIWWIENAFKNH